MVITSDEPCMRINTFDTGIKAVSTDELEI